MNLSQEIKKLRDCAAELAIAGDMVAAIAIDDLAYALGRGRTWDQLFDDVTVREPWVN